MIALNKCKWVFEIKEYNISEEKNFQWSARTKTMDKRINYQYANGGIGSLNCVRMFNTLTEIRTHIGKFVKLNGITDYSIVKAKED